MLYIKLTQAFARAPTLINVAITYQKQAIDKSSHKTQMPKEGKKI